MSDLPSGELLAEWTMKHPTSSLMKGPSCASQRRSKAIEAATVRSLGGNN